MLPTRPHNHPKMYPFGSTYRRRRWLYAGRTFWLLMAFVALLAASTVWVLQPAAERLSSLQTRVAADPSWYKAPPRNCAEARASGLPWLDGDDGLTCAMSGSTVPPSGD